MTDADNERYRSKLIPVLTPELKISDAELVSHKDPARRGYTVAHTAHKIADYGGDGVRSSGVRAEMTHHSRIRRETDSP